MSTTENRLSEIMFIETTNPANGEKLKQYSLLDEQTILSEIELSHQAFLHWRSVSVPDRVKEIKKIIDLLEQEKQACAELMSLEMGKPIKSAIAEIEKCQSCIHYYCENAEKFLGLNRILTEYKASYVCYKPLGVILAVMPWNFPFWQVFRFMIPCLLAGNVVLLKHASMVSGCGQKIEEIFSQADIPSRLIKHLLISASQVESVIKHSHVRGISLTGSEEAGKQIANSAGLHLKKVVMELGGNDACIVLKDANLELAAQSIVSSRLRNTGQVCVATKRVIVDSEVKTDLIALILQKIEDYSMLDPMNPESNFGPMARADLRDKVHQQVQALIQEGAHLICGGYLPQGPGFYYPPTVLDHVAVDSLAYQEELFGPVISITPFDKIQQAIEYANATRFGLGGNIFTQDLSLAEDLAQNQIDAGLCFVNMQVTSDPRFPFGGVKNSGYGRELSKEGLLEFVNIKTVIINE
jgi:succinate-semialdehyde dehydrogenase/glutarate-semialdehyde dehydrogenase